MRELQLEYKSFPFEGLTLDSMDVNVEKLEVEEIEAIIGLDLEKESHIWHARNYFLLAVYLGGVRISDILL